MKMFQASSQESREEILTCGLREGVTDRVSSPEED